MFLSAHSYTFVSSRSILSFFLPSSFFSFARFVLFFFFVANRRDKLADVLLTHSSTIHLLFTGRNKPSFLLRHLKLFYGSHRSHRVIPRASILFSLVPTCLQTCVLSRHRVLFSTCHQPDPGLTNFSDIRTSRA